MGHACVGSLYREELGNVTFRYDTQKAKVRHMQYNCTHLCTHLKEIWQVYMPLSHTMGYGILNSLMFICET